MRPLSQSTLAIIAPGGGPYAVLIAEQLRVSGVKLILGLTSAGRISPSLPLPCFVVVTSAVRDEGTSLRYLPPGEKIDCPTPINDLLTQELRQLGSTAIQGPVWTTDAPYRETAPQIQQHAAAGVLAVEMQAASLFAFASVQRTDIRHRLVASRTGHAFSLRNGWIL